MLPGKSYFASKVYAGMLPGGGLGQGPSWTSKECGGASLQNRVFEHFLHLFVLFIRIWRKSCILHTLGSYQAVQLMYLL